MQGYGFSLTRMFPYKDRILDFDLKYVRENLYFGIFYAVTFLKFYGR